ncbi:MAG: sugar ABC transporter permease [Burkholderiales bacterium]|jgi:multiple sugar transport system permease protein|nr:sugar ABC transporter permease [Burkholderiales bacterium]
MSSATFTRPAFAQPGWVGWAFIAPFLICYVGLLAAPVLEGFWLSLHAVDLLTGRGRFVGLANFIDLARDEIFLRCAANTVLFAAICTPLFVGLGLALALVLNRPGKLGAWLRGTFFASNVLSVTVVTLIWRLVLLPDRGLLSQGLQALGLSDLAPLSDERLALPFIALVTLWWGIGLPMTLMLAALQQVPPDLYEAAALDNASRWRSFRFITLPALRRTLVLVAIIQLLGQLQVFGQAQLLTNGGPNNSTRTMVMFIYEALFDQWALGYSAAAAQLLFVLLVLGVGVQRWAEKREGGAV